MRAGGGGPQPENPLWVMGYGLWVMGDALINCANASALLALYA
jgi:hypothetical protein